LIDSEEDSVEGRAAAEDISTNHRLDRSVGNQPGWPVPVAVPNDEKSVVESGATHSKNNSW
jgi:hypothetical protein